MKLWLTFFKIFEKQENIIDLYWTLYWYRWTFHEILLRVNLIEIAEIEKRELYFLKNFSRRVEFVAV